MKRFCAALFLFCVSGALFSQTNTEIDAQLAAEYFSQGKVEESISIYQSLLKQEFNQQYYEALLQIFYQQEQNKEAEKLIKKAIKQNPQSNVYSIDLGLFYLKISEEKQAKKTFDKVINDLKANSSDISQTANIFMSKNNLDYAALTYLKGRELLRNPLLFTYELGFIYERQGKYELIVQEYIGIVEENPSMLNQVKIYLGNLMTQQDNTALLDLAKKTIVEKVQKKTDNLTLPSLLVWIYMQEKDYKSAFTYAKALDKRLKEGCAYLVFEVAEIGLNNKDYEASFGAYKYLIDKGKDNPYYEQSLFGLLSSQYYEFVATDVHSEKTKKEIEKQYTTTLNEVGQNANSAPIMLQFANLLAYYLSKPQEAVDMITDILNMERINSLIKAEANLTLADILLMNNDVWAASLEYSKVELDFKNDELGSRAKFAKAKLSYYIGDFQQAAMQFDALRSSTSKFIANDAMEYSLLISDNIDEDSTYNGLLLYAKADLALYQHNPQVATQYLDTININYLHHSLFDEVLLKRAEIAIEERQYQQADSLLQLLVLKYPYDITADDALFLLAQINETHLANAQKAKQYYERIILDYPSSLYVTQARKRYQKISGEKAEVI
ncbi:MAG: tetratricopeptide repeat protein [Bacteroidales bacterium]|jgi:predicted Zn-dependent protease|nr:tetratricopeptide repeat protein [Bacteroidales bacterium]